MVEQVANSSFLINAFIAIVILIIGFGVSRYLKSFVYGMLKGAHIHLMLL